MDDAWIVKWYLDALFAVHNDMQSQTGAIMTLGKGVAQVVLTKQKTTTRSSTEAELISFDDIASKVLWTKLFLNEQGYQDKDNIVYRDNQAAMKLEMNDKTSSGKRTRHIDIKYFFTNDLINWKEIKIEFYPTTEMLGDYMTKPLVGMKFNEFRKKIMKTFEAK
jgi:hypothetical protein